MSLLKRLVERRVPQYLALYAGVGWGFLQFMVFLQDTYMLSTEWTKLALLALVLLIPSVILFSFFHGRPGRDRWMRLELIAIPINVLVALIVLFIEFGGKDLGAQVETVTLTDETGQQIERTIPKSEYRKRIAVFYFDGMDGDTSRWLQYGVPTAVLSDLAQDMFVDMRFGAFFRERLRKAGLKSELNVPLALKREIARDQHLGYVLSGAVKQAGGQYTAKVALHESVSSKQLGEWTFTEATPQALADRISLEVRKGMGIPGKHIEQSADLPVAETLTPSVEAFQHFGDAQHFMEVGDDYAAATSALERAVAGDPTFANAHYGLYAMYLLTNQAGKAMGSLQATMDHLYRMPERLQNIIKLEHYFMTQQQDKAFAVAQLNTELYPDDIRSLQLLAQLQVMRDEKDGAIGSLRRMLELDPQQAEMLQQIGDLYFAKGRYDTALTYFSQYAERFPQKREAFMKLGDVQVRAGRPGEAKRDYEKALLLEPNAVPVMLRLASLDRNQGNLGAAQKGYDQALAAARTPEERAQVHAAMRSFAEMRGRHREALMHHQQAQAEVAKVAAPLMVAVDEMRALGLYVRAGRADEAEQRYAKLRKELVAPMDMYLPIGEMQVAVARGQHERAATAIAAADRMIQAMGLRIMAYEPLRARGDMHKQKGEWQQALQAYERVLALEPTQIEANAEIAECLRNLGQLDRAAAAVEKLLAVQPGNPRANLEAGLIAVGRGRAGEARTYLQRAVDTWAEADPDHRYAPVARQALAQLGRAPRA